MSATTPSGWPKPGRTRPCSRCSARAIWRSPSTSRRPRSATRGSSRSKARAWPRPRKAISPSPSRSRRSSGSRRARTTTAGSPAGCMFQHLPEGEEGRDRLHTRLDHPEWPHVAALAGSVKPEELIDPDAAARRTGVAAVPRGGGSAHAGAGGAVEGAAAAAPTMSRSVIARFPPEERAAMVGEDGMIRVDCEFCATSFPIALRSCRKLRHSFG